METLESSILIPQGKKKKKKKETKQNKNILRVGGKCFVALLRNIPCGENMKLKGHNWPRVLTKFENQERWRLRTLQVVIMIFSACYPLAASGYTIQRKTKSQSLVQKTAMIFTVFMMTEDVRVKCGTFS